MLKAIFLSSILFSASWKPTRSAEPQIRRRLTSLSPSQETDNGIPHTFWFSHSNNIFLTKEPEDVYHNVLDTIEKYRTLWGDPVGLQFLDEVYCRETILQAEPKLLTFYDSEVDESTRGDICKTAALYVWGGYFFDTDVEVHDLVRPEDATRFVAISDCGGGCFSPAFLASTPGHLMLKLTLQNMVQIYEGNQDAKVSAWVMMAKIYNSLPQPDREDVALLEVLRIDDDSQNQLQQVDIVSGQTECNDVFHDREKKTVHFLKRFRRAGGCVRRQLRMDWTNLPPLSPLAKQIDSVQSKCLTEYSQEQLKFKKREQVGLSGLGADLIYYSASLCDAMDRDMIVVNRNGWTWMDTDKCPYDTSIASPFQCYFGKHESAAFCEITQGGNLEFDEIVTTAVDPYENWRTCRGHESETSTREFRSATFEWLFQSVHPRVIEEAERQVREAFGTEGLPNPEDLVTVHIRWGDKYTEMDLQPIDAYVDAVKNMTRDRSSSKPLHIYLASEDPHAIKEFHEKKPPEWIVHMSGPTNDENESDMLKNASGRAGLESLGALLVSLEANTYVLTLASNWSHLIDYLRRSILDPRCGKCTRMTDLLFAYV